MPTLQNSNKQIIFISYSPKQIMKGEKQFLQISGGLGPRLLKRCYRTTKITYAPPRPKCFIAFNCPSSLPIQPYPIYKSSHKNGNLIRKWDFNTIFCMIQHGNMIMKDQFSTPSTIMRRNPLHTNCSAIWFAMEGNVEHIMNLTRVFPRYLSPNGWLMWRKIQVFTHGTWCINEIGTT